MTGYRESFMDKAFRALARPYLVTDGTRFTLKNHNPRGPGTSAAHQRWIHGVDGDEFAEQTECGIHGGR